MFRCELVPVVRDRTSDDDAMAVATGVLPLFWLTLFTDDDLEVAAPGLLLTAPTSAAIERSTARLAELTARHPGAYDDLARTWLDFLADTDADRLVMRVDDRTTEPEIRARLRDPWPEGLPHHPAAGNDPDTAARLCGLPRFRPVPWPVPAPAPHPGGDESAPGVAPHEVARRGPRRSAPKNPKPAHPNRPGPPTTVFSPGWLCTGPALVAVLWAIGPGIPQTDRLPNDRPVALALLGLLAIAGLVRVRWPLAALLVMACATLTRVGLGFELDALDAILVFALATVAYRSPWPRVVIAYVLAVAVLWIAIAVADPSTSRVEAFLGLTSYLAVATAVAVALRLVISRSRASPAPVTDHELLPASRRTTLACFPEYRPEQDMFQDVNGRGRVDDNR